MVDGATADGWVKKAFAEEMRTAIDRIDFIVRLMIFAVLLAQRGVKSNGMPNADLRKKNGKG